MSSTLAPSDLSWTVPVPVRASRFTPLLPEHQRLCVETDLARIGTFATGGANEAAEVGYSDLQTSADTNAHRRLGSGRALYYQGAYLKGVGRTLLTGNWSDPGDRYHNSGHMLPSAAARELIASRVVRRAVGSSSIVECTGLAVCDVEGGVDVGAILPESVSDFAPVDRRCQAMTVKPGDFARFSNFVWALNHNGTSTHELAQALHAVHVYLRAPAERRVAAQDGSPDAIARALRDAINRGLRSFADFVRAGVHWGSVHNNFTADGRFMDLEVPVIVGRAFFGGTRDLSCAGTLPDWVGLEMLSYARQARLFVAWLAARMDFFAEFLLAEGAPRDFAAALAAEVRGLLDGDDPWVTQERTAEHLSRVIGDELGMNSRQRALVRDLAAHHARGSAAFGEPEPRVEMTEISLDLADSEPGIRRVCEVPKLLAPLYESGFELGRVANDALRYIESATSADDMLARTRQSLREIDAVNAPSHERSAS